MLLSYQVGLTSVDDLIVRNVVFEVLDDFDSQVEIMISVTVDELAYVLSLVGTLLHNLAIVLEKVIQEELVKLISWARLVLVNLSGKCLAED